MWAIVLKPLGLVVFFACVVYVSRIIGRFIPEGRLKRILFFSWRA